MSLVNYKKKRSADKTPEPFGGKVSATQLRFVIQKHAASRLHYDFRLEMDGVLKSWAVPKGPSTDPAVKRLAMMVEDHPYDYRNFEGVIPQGQYGGGAVIVWDEGTYVPDEEIKGKKARERHLLQQLKAGSLKFRLNGQKLKGSFALVRTKGMAENAWLLIKHKDEYAAKKDITKADRSVQSGRNLDEVKAHPERIYGQDKQDKKTQPTAPEVKSRTPKKIPATELKTLLKGAPKRALDTELSPMLATLVDQPFDSTDWHYEIKWDGYRTLAFRHKNTTSLRSRNNKSFDERFYPIYDALSGWPADVVIDGEIVCLDAEGRASFGQLQQWRSEADGDLVYYVFDILWYQGHDLTGLPLQQRRALLQQLLPEHPLIRFSEDFGTSGIDFLEAAKNMGIEGIMAKKKDSLYLPGERSSDWLKIKAAQRQEMVIGGYTHNEGSSKPFSSLLLGVYRNKKLVYTGKVGTGFSLKTQRELLQQFRPLIRKTSPFGQEPDINAPSRFRPNPPHASATWLSPKLVCEVSFTEMTADGVMRHPSFEGMRSDKNAGSVRLETAADTATLVGKRNESAFLQPISDKSRKTLLNPGDASQQRTLSGHKISFSNLDKIYWPAEKYTKRDLINYYYQAAPYILPYLKGRPQSLNRFPNGIKGKSFYQKDVTGKVPDWMDTYLYHSEGDSTDKHFLLGNNEATLLSMANMGCIEMNPWSSTVKRPEHPDWCIIDLDPGKNTFDEVIEAALATRQVLDNLGIPGYPKTSGATGMHIYIPLGAKYTYDQSKELARLIVTLVHEQLPDLTSIARSIRSRKGKMYLDFLQNRPQATIAAPYSVRPRPGATVSMPLRWEEVKKGLKVSDFTIANAISRIRSMGDIFKPVLGKGINLKKILEAYLPAEEPAEPKKRSTKK